MVKQQQDETPASQPCSCRRRCLKGKLSHREEGGQLDHQPVKSHSFEADSSGAMRVQSVQSVHSCRSHTPLQSEIFADHNNHNCSSFQDHNTQSEILGLQPRHQYHQPQEDQETSILRAISSVTKTHRTL